MVATVILLIVLILILIIIMIFSINLHIIISFCTSTKDLLYNNQKSYSYAVCVNRIFRTTNDKKKKKKSTTAHKVYESIKKSKKHIEITDVSILGNISFGNAADTALVAGILNIVSGNIIAYLSTFSSKISISQINIRPVYNEQIEGEIFFECIVKVNAGNIIAESIKHFKNKHLYEKGSN